MHSNALDPKVLAFKRRSYLIILPLGLLAFLLPWIFGLSSAQLSAFDGLALPLVALVLAGFNLALLARKIPLPQLEIGIFSSLCLFFLVKLSFYLFSGQNAADVSSGLTEFAYWFPVLYALAFLMFGSARGRRVSLLLYTTTLFVGMVYVLPSILAGERGEVFALSQMYFASGALIVLFMLFARITELHAGSARDMAQLAFTDALTKLNNRRQIEKSLGDEVKRAQRYGRPFSVVLVDIDHFKEVNDRYGHDVGDSVLRELAHLLVAENRISDQAGRWGGEEFLLILSETTLEQALGVASRLRLRVIGHRFARVGKLTASFGVADFQFDDSVKALVRRADEALYAAKTGGRDKVVGAYADPWDKTALAPHFIDAESVRFQS